MHIWSSTRTSYDGIPLIWLLMCFSLAALCCCCLLDACFWWGTILQQMDWSKNNHVAQRNSIPNLFVKYLVFLRLSRSIIIFRFWLFIIFNNMNLLCAKWTFRYHLYVLCRVFHLNFCHFFWCKCDTIQNVILEYAFDS